MERKEAMERGLYKFETGRPCANGHIAHRYTQSGSCSRCINNGMPLDYNKERAAVTELLSATTSLIKIYVTKETVDAVKIIVDLYNIQKLPQIPANYINPFPFRLTKIRGDSNTFRTQVVVPTEYAEDIKALCNALLPKVTP